MKKTLLPILFLICSAPALMAQSFMGWEYNDRFFSAYIGTGRAGYLGELTNGKPLASGLSLVNFGVEARLLSQLGAKVQIAKYRLEGSDENAADSSANRQRNLSFFSKNYEISLQAIYYLFPYTGKYHTRRTYEPYIGLGVGYNTFNPKTTLDGVEYTLSDYRTENQDYAKSGIVFPISLGVKAKLNEFMNLNLDLGYRIIFTDYLDDVSGVYGGPYPDGSIPSRLSNRKDEIPQVNDAVYEQLITGNARGNPTTKDKYFFINFSVEIYAPRDLFKSRGGKTRKEKIIGKPSAY
ncbi:MAG: outer membrane beta-barrel protein [Cyclobacteriaceae bacterium]